jgi:hypothetical protein
MLPIWTMSPIDDGLAAMQNRPIVESGLSWNQMNIFL